MGNIQNFYHNDTFSASSNGSIGIHTTDPVTAYQTLTLKGSSGPLISFNTQTEQDGGKFTRIISDGSIINFFTSATSTIVGTTHFSAITLCLKNAGTGIGATVGIGTSSPFSTASANSGLNIDKGGHSSLLIGDGINDGGMIQSSDNSQRIIIGANVYDSPTNSWSRWNASGAALVDVYGENNNAFISLNVDAATSGFPSAKLTVSNTGNIQFNSYGAGTLVTDASGNITASSGGGAGGPYFPLAGSVYDGNTATWSNGVTGDLALVSTSGTKGIIIGDEDNGAGQLFVQFNSSNGTGILTNNGGNLEITAQNYGDGSDIIFRGNDTSNNLVTYFQTVGASQKVRVLDNIKLTIGTSDDLQISHDGFDSYINNFTGNLNIVNLANDKDIIFKSDDGLGGTTEYFRVDGGESNTIFSRNLKFLDSGLPSRKLIFGTGDDLQIYHDGANSYIKNATGDLYIQQSADDKDLVFQCDNGSGGLVEYFRLDGSVAGSPYVYTKFPDYSVATFGNGNNLQIYHTDTTGFISEYEGDLRIINHADDKDILFQSDDGAGSVATYFQIDGSDVISKAHKNIRFLDNVKANFGNSDDLQIYHDGSNSYIRDQGTGNLIITGSQLTFSNVADTEYMVKMVQDGTVELYYNGSKKLETTSAGVAVTGSLSTTEDISVVGDVMISGTTTAGGTLICEGNITVQDSDKLQLGNSQDLELYHASGVSYIDNDTGHLYIRNNVDNDDGSNIYIQAKSGENSILCQDDGAVGLYNNNVQMFSTNSTGVGAYGYIGFGSAGTSTGTSYGFRYGSSSPSGSQGIVISVSDTGGAYFDGVGRFQNTNTGQGAGMFQMVNYGSLYGRYMQFFRGSTSNIIGYIGYNSSNTSVTFSTTNSDIRTKKNITTWDENVLDKFKALQPKRFDFKVAIGDKGAVKERGFIAQYEKDNFPEAYQLNGNDEKATYGFHPMEMVPYMMKAIKDLTVKNEELERRIKTLES